MKEVWYQTRIRSPIVRALDPKWSRLVAHSLYWIAEDSSSTSPTNGKRRQCCHYENSVATDQWKAMTTLLGYTCDLIIIYPSQCEARYVYHMDEWLRPFRPLLETVIEIGKTYVRLYSSFTSSYVRHCFVSFITDKHTVVTRQPSGPQNATETAGRGALPNLASRWQDRHVHSRLSGRREQEAPCSWRQQSATLRSHTAPTRVRPAAWHDHLGKVRITKSSPAVSRRKLARKPPIS